MTNSRKNFHFVGEQDLEALYAESVRKAHQFKSSLSSELRIHPTHSESVGYWTSNRDMLDQVACKWNLPLIEQAVVVPYYHQNMELAHIKFLSNIKGRYQLVGAGTSTNGWFNLLPVVREYKIREQHDPSRRLLIYDKLLSALKSDDGLHSDNINHTNLGNLRSFCNRLLLKGQTEFVEMFKKIEGFDIQIGGTNISDFLNRNFCWQELTDIDDRARVPRAVEYMKELPVYERIKFNLEFMSRFKLDLRNIAPLLFENFMDERRFMEKVKEYYRESFVGSSFSCENGDPLLSITIKEKGSFRVRDANQLANVLSVVQGQDLVEWAFSLGGIPASYYYDRETNTRLIRPVVYERLSALFFMLLLGMMNELK